MSVKEWDKASTRHCMHDAHTVFAPSPLKSLWEQRSSGQNKYENTLPSCSRWKRSLLILIGAVLRGKQCFVSGGP